MVVVDTYICKECGYKYTNKAEIFYFNENLTELEVTLKLALTLRNLSKSPLYGSAHEKYCPQCNEYIRTYTVYKNTNKKNLSNEEIINKINELSKRKTNIITIEEGKNNNGENKPSVSSYMKVKKEEEYCPVCGEKIYAVYNDMKCPKCRKGKLNIECGVCKIDRK